MNDVFVIMSCWNNQCEAYEITVFFNDLYYTFHDIRVLHDFF